MGILKGTKDRLNTRRANHKKVICAAVALLAVICIFIAAGSFLKIRQDKGHTTAVAYPSGPKLPRISFLAEGKEINTIPGYTGDMDIAAMRDTVTPVPEDGLLTAIVKNMGSVPAKLNYEIYSLDGGRLIWRDSSPIQKDGTAALALKDIFPCGGGADKDGERVLKVILEIGGGKEKRRVCYFTRVVSQKGLSLKQCMDFAEDFHGKAFDKKSEEELSRYAEPDASADNYTLAHVTIHSDTDQITWGRMRPEVQGGAEWKITEANTVYTSLQAMYKVKCAGEFGEAEYYNVKEFFRVRCLEGEMYLLGYDRTMGRVFAPDETVLTKEGILLGAVPEDTEYAVAPGGKAAAFVLQGALWLYDIKPARLYLVSGLTDGEGGITPGALGLNDIRIIGMDENGSMVFAVYGYMDRGNHEGSVGASVCYFDIDKNTVVEKAFIPSSKSYAIAGHELGKMLYYSHEREMLYVITGGKLLEADLEKNLSKVSDADLSGGYMVSGDGHLLAFGDGGKEAAGRIAVMDLKTGKTTFFKAPRGEKISLLGFIKSDVIYGFKRPRDKGVTSAGEGIWPMYKVEIADTAGNVAKKYSAGDMFISGVGIEGDFVTVRRVRDDGGVYIKCEDDHISDTEEREGDGIRLKSFYAEPAQRQMLLAVPEGKPKKQVKVLRAGMISEGKNITVPFESGPLGEVYYVYGLGELQGVYHDAAAAINKADSVGGAVISKDQSYVWERGNRDLIYYTDAAEFTIKGQESSLDACVRALGVYEGEMADLTGCTLKQIYYIVNRWSPVIMMADEKKAVLITGYSTINVEYIDPSDGKRHYADNDEMEEMAKRGGNVFFGKMK